MDGGEAAIGAEGGEEGLLLLRAGAMVEGEEAGEGGGEAGVADRRAVGEAERAKHDVVRRPRPDAAQSEEPRLDLLLGLFGQAVERQLARGHGARRADQVL